VTPVIDQPRPSLKRFQREEEARIAAEQEKREAEERARFDELDKPLKEAARLASVRIAAYWSQPLAEIQTNGIDMTPLDLAGDYETGQRDDKAETAAWNEFNANLTSQGCSLYRGGFQRLQMYLESLAYHRGVCLTSLNNWQAALARLHSLSVFEPHEVEGYQLTARQATPAPPERPADPLAEIETLNLDTREGSRRGREIVSGLVGNEEKAAWEAFIQGIYEATGHLLTNQERLAIFNTCKRHSLDIRNPRRLREVVVALCKTGELSADKLLSEQDKLDAFIEASDLSDIAVRQEIGRRQRAIHETAERKRLGF
jgi:hypothetical protein